MTLGNMWKHDVNPGLFNVVFSTHVVVVRSTTPESITALCYHLSA
jgi:hypothetical protein